MGLQKYGGRIEMYLDTKIRFENLIFKKVNTKKLISNEASDITGA